MSYMPENIVRKPAELSEEQWHILQSAPDAQRTLSAPAEGHGMGLSSLSRLIRRHTGRAPRSTAPLIPAGRICKIEYMQNKFRPCFFPPAAVNLWYQEKAELYARAARLAAGSRHGICGDGAGLAETCGLIETVEKAAEI